MPRLFFLLILFGANLGWGAPPVWAFKSQLEFFAAAQNQQTIDSWFNAGNRVLQIPRYSFLTQTRGEFRLIYRNRVRLVARPLFNLNYQDLYFDLPSERRQPTTGRFDLSDLYLEWALPKSTFLAAGLLSYQWGPAEFFSPSNPLFHFDPTSKSFMFKQKGKVLIKLRSNLNDNLNLIWLSEVLDNRERHWMAERSFSPSHLLKLEQRFKNSFNYVGLTTGLSEDLPFLGEYANWVISDGYSVYLDGRHTQGAQRFQPEMGSLGFYNMNLSPEDKSEISHFIVSGFRWEGNADARLEYIYNSLGYDADTLKNAISSATILSPQIAQNILHLALPGLEMLGQRYAYFSIRVADLGTKKDVGATLRYLHSLQDQSGSLQGNLEKPLTDSAVGYMDLAMATGEDKKELTLGDRWQWMAGFKWTR